MFLYCYFLYYICSCTVVVEYQILLHYINYFVVLCYCIFICFICSCTVIVEYNILLYYINCSIVM